MSGVKMPKTGQSLPANTRSCHLTACCSSFDRIYNCNTDSTAGTANAAEIESTNRYAVRGLRIDKGRFISSGLGEVVEHRWTSWRRSHSPSSPVNYPPHA